MNNPFNSISSLFKRMKIQPQNIRDWFTFKNIVDKKRYVFRGFIATGICYYLYYHYKLNNSMFIKVYPPFPSSGVIEDEEQVKYLAETYKDTFNSKKGLNTFCIYGKLGCGKSILTKQLCEHLIESKSRWFSTPKSEIITFVNCSSQESFIDSLMQICKKISKDSGSDDKLNAFSTEIIDQSFDSKVEYYLSYILKTLKQHPGWILVFDNINEFSYSCLRDQFKKYIFTDSLKLYKGSIFLVCDTTEASFMNVPLSYCMHGLSYDASLELLSKFSLISKQDLSQEALQKILPLIHSQPLSAISFGILVKETLKNSNCSISSAINGTEELINTRIKQKVNDNNISLSPQNFEPYFVHTLIQMLLDKMEQEPDSKVLLKLLSTASLLSPFASVPETLLSRFLSAYNEHSSLSNIDEHPKFKKENIVENKEQSFLENIRNQYKLAKNAYYETKQQILDAQRVQQTINLIRPEEKVSQRLKDSPFFNITHGDSQDYFHIHPIVYEEIRSKLFDSNWKLFMDENKPSSSSYFSSFFSMFSSKDTISNAGMLPKAWCVLNSKTSYNDINHKDIDTLEESKIVTLRRIQSIIQSCLSQTEHIRYPEYDELVLLRTHHLKSFLAETKKACADFTVYNKDIKLSINDAIYISKLENSLASAFNEISMFSHSEVTSKASMKYITELFPNSLKTQLKDEIMIFFINTCESLIRQKKVAEAYSNLSKLWSLVAPNEVNGYPELSSKLIRLVVEYNKLCENKIGEMDELSLICHAIQKLNISIRNRSDSNISDESLGVELMKLQVLYAEELIKHGYLDYADYIISESDKFNEEILKVGQNNVPSPFDEAIKDLNLYLNVFKGDTQHVLSILNRN